MRSHVWELRHAAPPVRAAIPRPSASAPAQLRLLHDVRAPHVRHAMKGHGYFARAPKKQWRPAGHPTHLPVGQVRFADLPDEGLPAPVRVPTGGDSLRRRNLNRDLRRDPCRRTINAIAARLADNAPSANTNSDKEGVINNSANLPGNLSDPVRADTLRTPAP